MIKLINSVVTLLCKFGANMKLGNRKTAGMKADDIETAKGSGQYKALEGLQANPHLKWGCLT